MVGSSAMLWRVYGFISAAFMMCLLVYLYRQPVTVVNMNTGSESTKHAPEWSPPNVALPKQNTRVSTMDALKVLRRDGVSYRLSDVNIDKMTDQQLRLTIHSILDNTDTICTRKIRMGEMDDGGWEVCDDPDVAPEPPCIIYSLGIAGDFSFDDDVSRIYGCDVFSLDPSVQDKDFERSKLVHFRKIGIFGKTEVNSKKWQLFTLNDLKKKLGHENQTISVIKMDVESSEWSALPEMVSSGALNGVNQLLVEYHVVGASRDYLLGRLKTIKAIEKCGFKKFYVHKNWHCKTRVKTFPVERTMCYEIHYVYRP